MSLMSFYQKSLILVRFGAAELKNSPISFIYEKFHEIFNSVSSASILNIFFNHDRIIFYPKSFILVYFRSLEFNIWWNYSEILNETFHRIYNSVAFSALELNVFFSHGEELNEFLPKIIHSGVFQMSWIDNFLQPWWNIE